MPVGRTDPCAPPAVSCARGAGSIAANGTLFAWFDRMIENCVAYAKAQKSAGRPLIGIMCEYAPRELILAAGGAPICLCGGSAKTIPAAEEHLPSNLCPLIKSTYGYHLTRSNPFLEMADLVVAETTCDGKKKMFELLGESRPTYVLELPQKESDADAIEHWTRELRKFKAFLEERFGVEITDCKIRQGIATMNRERQLRREVAHAMAADAPPLTGRELLKVKSTISGMPETFAEYEKLLAALPGREVEPDRASRVRVLLTGVPVVHGAERVIDLIEGHGGLIVAQENCTGLKPIWEDVDETASDPLRALAERYYRIPCSVRTPNRGRADLIRRLAAEYRAHCVVDLIWQACLTYDVESFQIRRLAQEELGLPYLRIETDYSPSDSARIAVRVEALFETVRASQPDGARCCGQ
jgi:benzoyl-CoA reductase/2-hydroxyglutaryl-CoA dehydratase subunit BcrC/BadD/HgdB